MPRVDPRLVTSVLLHFDVGDRRRVIAHDDRGQARFDAETSRELRSALGAVGNDLFGQSGSVHETCGRQWAPWFWLGSTRGNPDSSETMALGEWPTDPNPSLSDAAPRYTDAGIPKFVWSHL